METNKALQLRTSNSNLPAIANAGVLAQIRLDEEHYPRYRNIAPQSRMEWVAGQIQYLASISRIRDFDAREPILMSSALDEMISADKDMMDLTLPEIADAFKSGVFGLFGEFYGLSAPNLFGFIRSFLESEKKRDAAALVSKSRSDEYMKRTAIERAARQRAIQEEIAEAKRTGAFVPTGQVWFKPQMVNEAISSKEHREKVRQQAREILNHQ